LGDLTDALIGFLQEILVLLHPSFKKLLAFEKPSLLEFPKDPIVIPLAWICTSNCLALHLFLTNKMSWCIQAVQLLIDVFNYLGEPSLLWVDKYRPRSVKQIIGQQGDKSNMRKLMNWLRDWEKNRKKPPTKCK